ncbi:MAG: hypothetical protein KKG75_03800 [Nanoarchaeota archaeon]|nr:hypothetical protein [Nanoarchaeota archaeon]
MEIISKISKGTKMDQIYIPKNRQGLEPGTYVKIIPIEEKTIERSYFYNIKELEPIKLEIVNKIFSIIKNLTKYNNIIIAGSLLDKGFNFKDIDVLLINEEKINEKNVEKILESRLKIPIHLIHMTQKELKKALMIDPIWRIMLNKSISYKRIPPLPKTNLNYKYLDAQMIKSNLLIENSECLTGNEKYKLTRNLIAIYLFVKQKHLSKENIEREIEEKFNIESEELKNNIIDEKFIKKYKKFYKKFEKEIIKNAAKQEKAN